MKILIVRMYPSKMNINTYNVQEIGLAKELVKKGHQCDIVFYNGLAKSEFMDIKVDVNHSIKIYWLPCINFLKNAFFIGLKKIMMQYDIIQTAEYDQIGSWLLYSFSKKPIVVYHGPYYCSFNKGYNIKTFIFDRVFLKIRRNKKATFIAKSTLAADYLYSKKFEKVYTVGVGLDTNSLLAEVRTNEKLESIFNEECKFLVYVGKIEERRNTKFLINVLSRLCANHDDVKLILVGSADNTYLKNIKQYISELNLTDKVIFVDSLRQNELPYLYKTSTAFVFPSYYDIFGMVLLEAMYYGLPAVSSLNGGSSMIIENEYNSIQIKEFNEEKWACEIEKLIYNTKLLEEFSKRAKAKIEYEFLWEPISEKMIEIYKQCIDERKESR